MWTVSQVAEVAPSSGSQATATWRSACSRRKGKEVDPETERFRQRFKAAEP